jgi:hypothetical protein
LYISLEKEEVVLDLEAFTALEESSTCFTGLQEQATRKILRIHTYLKF